MEVEIGKGVQDPKGHAVARHECNISFFVTVYGKCEVTNYLLYIPIAWGFLWAIERRVSRILVFPPQANPLVKHIELW